MSDYFFDYLKNIKSPEHTILQGFWTSFK